MSAKLVVTSLVFANVFIPSISQEACNLANGKRGTCKPLNSCPEAMEELKNKVAPKICTFKQNEPTICCQNRRKSDKKCMEYSRMALVWAGDEDPLITGGEDAVSKEFPHMAVLGYGSEDNIQWKCGGSLISDQFVLTAAHCLYSDASGEVKYVRLGDLDLYSTRDDADPQQFNVIKSIAYQEYVPPSSYHDIALLQLDKPVVFTEYVRPACIQTEYHVDNVTLKATGWGALTFGTDNHSYLQKVDLHQFVKKDCNVTYKPGVNLREGIWDKTQICAGSFVGGRDSCQGDSGGPLQMLIKNKPLMYKVVGIVSIGKHCGLVPGLYTRVSAYTTWIEELVWPN